MNPSQDAPGTEPDTAGPTSDVAAVEQGAWDARSRTILALIVSALVLMAASAGGFAALSIPAQSSTSTAVAEVMEVDGLLHLVTGDLTRLRIQQPGSFELAELEAAGVQLGGEVTQLVVAPEPTNSRLVTVPPDGPDARLHLLVDGVLYPVVVNDADHADLSAFGDAPVAILGQLDVAG